MSTSSIFPNALYPQFNGENNVNNFVGGNIVYHTNRSPASSEKILKPLEELQYHSTLDALVDSIERFDSPRCADNTREKAIRHLLDWIDGEDPLPSVFWLYGSAGAGKTALMQTVAELLKRERRLLGTFFFSRTAGSSDRSNGNRLIPTLVLQLIQEFPETKSRVANYIKYNPTIFSRAREVQMASLFTSPLFQFSLRRFIRSLTERKKSRLIVIDGLDECQEPGIQCDLLRIIASTVAKLRLPLRFLIASRPEPHIRRAFNHDPLFQRISCYRINLDEDNTVRTGIKNFLFQELEKIRSTHPFGRFLDSSWPSQDDIEDLLTKSGTQFIYASIVIKYIQSPKHKPDDRLLNILKVSASTTMTHNPLGQLDALYAFIFAAVDEEHRAVVWLILALLCIAGRYQDDHIFPKLTAHTVEKILSLKTGEVYLYLDPLSSVISCPENADDPISVLHATLFDYLLDSSRSGKFTLDLGVGYEPLAMYYFTIIPKEHQWPDSFTGPGTDYYWTVHGFLDHAQKAHLSLRLMNFLCSATGEILAFEPSQTEGLWTFTVLQLLAGIFLRNDFVNGRLLLLAQLEHFYHHISQQISTSVPPIYGDLNNPYFPTTNDSSSVLNAIHRIYVAIFNYEASLYKGTQQGIKAPHTGQQTVSIPLPLTNRFLKHFVIILSSATASPGADPHWLNSLIKMHQTAQLAINDGDLHAVLDAACSPYIESEDQETLTFTVGAFITEPH